MGKVKHTLRGSTLVETLVMMIVAGIIFLAVMDGLTLFTRLQTRRAMALSAAGCEAEGYHRLKMLLLAADTIRPVSGFLELYHNGRQSALILSDSVLTYHTQDFRDTLLSHIAALRLTECTGQPDTLEVRFATGFTARFAARQKTAESYADEIEKIECGYEYD